MASPTGQTGLAKYPAQLTLVLGPKLTRRIADEAATFRLSKSEVARLYLQAGLDGAAPGLRIETERPEWGDGWTLPQTQVIVSCSNEMSEQISDMWAADPFKGMRITKSAVARALIIRGMEIADAA